MIENLMDDIMKKDSLVDGIYYIINNKSGKYMDVLYSATANRSPIGQWDKTCCENQKFILTSKGNDEWEISSVYAKKAVDVENSSANLGARVIIFDKNNTTAQRFKIVKNKHGVYNILTKTSNYQNAIGVENSSNDKGAVLKQTKSDDSSAAWVLEKI